jgi:hypothetical protein
MFLSCFEGVNTMGNERNKLLGRRLGRAFLALAMGLLLGAVGGFVPGANAAEFVVGTERTFPASGSVVLNQSGWYYIEAWGGHGGGTEAYGSGATCLSGGGQEPAHCRIFLFQRWGYPLYTGWCRGW